MIKMDDWRIKNTCPFGLEINAFKKITLVFKRVIKENFKKHSATLITTKFSESALKQNSTPVKLSFCPFNSVQNKFSLNKFSKKITKEERSGANKLKKKRLKSNAFFLWKILKKIVFYTNNLSIWVSEEVKSTCNYYCW